jgi:hypothetical protein
VDLQLLEAVTGRIVLQMTVSKSRRFEKALQLVGLVHGACDVSVVQAFPHSRTMAMQQSISLCPPQSVHHRSRISRSGGGANFRMYMRGMGMSGDHGSRGAAGRAAALLRWRCINVTLSLSD